MRMDFETKLVLSHVKAEKTKKMGGSLLFLPLKIMKNIQLQLGKKINVQNLSGTNRNVYQKYIGHIVIKFTRNMVYIYFPIFCYTIKYEIK